MILVTQCFEIVTHESAEDGAAAESGFIEEDISYSFRELVEALRGGEPSSWPCRGCTHDWVAVDKGETRAYFEKGEREYRSFHFSRKNPDSKAKYWRKAMIAAGLAK